MGALLAVFVLSAAPALANAGKVLVFTGTAGTPNAASADAVTAIKALGAANDFTVDNTADKADINAANLAKYRAVVFVNSSGDALDAGRRDRAAGLRPDRWRLRRHRRERAARAGRRRVLQHVDRPHRHPHHGHRRPSAADVEFLDRVHPSTRQLPLVDKAQTETWYTWATNPSGTVHTVARVRGNVLPDGTSVPNDAVSRFTAPTAGRRSSRSSSAPPPGAATSSRAAPSTPSSAPRPPASPPPTSRSTCSARSSGRPAWSAAAARPASTPTTRRPGSPRSRPERHVERLLRRDDEVGARRRRPRLLRRPRHLLPDYVQISNWDSANTGLGCGTIHVWDPRVAGHQHPEPGQDLQGRRASRSSAPRAARRVRPELDL